MNYAYQYFKLICKRIEQPLTKDDCYVEEHHIIPKSECGTNDAWNLVNLTAREHYVAHKLLYKIYNDEKMALAFLLMSDRLHNNNSKMYENAKIVARQLQSEGGKKGIAKMTREQRSEAGKKSMAKLTAEQRSERGRKACEKLTFEQRSKGGKKGGKKGGETLKGKKWFNNGIKTVRAFECPNGFTKGRLKMKRKHKVHE